MLSARLNTPTVRGTGSARRLPLPSCALAPAASALYRCHTQVCAGRLGPAVLLADVPVPPTPPGPGPGSVHIAKRKLVRAVRTTLAAGPLSGQAAAIARLERGEMLREKRRRKTKVLHCAAAAMEEAQHRMGAVEGRRKRAETTGQHTVAATEAWRHTWGEVGVRGRQRTAEWEEVPHTMAVGARHWMAAMRP